MKKNILLIFLALVVVAGTYAVLSATVRPVPVVVAKQDLMAGVQLTDELVELKTLPRGGAPQGAFQNVAEVTGKTLVVARVAGDPLTAYVVGEASSASGIPAMLEPNTVAIAVRVDQATGLAGVLRPGQKVTVIGVIDPASIPQGQLGLTVAPAPNFVSVPTLSTYDAQGLPAVTPAPTATPEPPVSPVARITVSGLKVLVVPQTFRYEEASATGEGSSAFLPARTTTQQQKDNVVLLQASILPSEIAPGVFASPAEVLALLNDKALIHLVLEPPQGVHADVSAQGIDLARLYQAITGRRLIP